MKNSKSNLLEQEWLLECIERLPQGMLSRAWGQLARTRYPKTFVRLLQRFFVAANNIDLSEAEEQLGDFASLEELFIRKLKAGARRVDPDPEVMVSPVDGTLGSCGSIEDGTLWQIKGKTYTLEDLLDEGDEAEAFKSGSFMTFYLSPRDYHRVHSPLSGQVKKAVLIPGALMPVFPLAVQKVDKLFAKNERIITYIDTAHMGRIAVVMIGAMLVGRMFVTYDDDLCSNLRGQLRHQKRYEPAHLLRKGVELGRFEMGSSVVILSEKKIKSFELEEEGCSVSMGQALAKMQVKSRSAKKKATSKAKSLK
ncbi:MAG: archaetidylserine decarboxylase [Myxococcota bacterium]|jgi:phosphatidylserine decarboxylase|nr:archaetidylserine decarboxylase [Myxococcota bacterium]